MRPSFYPRRKGDSIVRETLRSKSCFTVCKAPWSVAGQTGVRRDAR